MSSECSMNRRGFLKTVAGSAAAAGLAGCGSGGNLLSGFAGDNGMKAATAILRANGYSDDLAAIIEDGFALVPPPEVAGKRVLLKPNLLDVVRSGRPIITHPQVVIGAARAFLRRGAAEVIVADGPAIQRDAMQIVDAAGLTPLLDEEGIRFVDLNTDDVVKTANAGRFLDDADLFISATAYHADVLVSMPKLKTHHWAGVTLSMKNLFGIMPGAVYGWPKNHFHLPNLHDAVMDFNLTRPADYAIVDGIVGGQGDGPILPDPIDAGVLIMGDNPTAVDATCARVMTLRPAAISYINRAAGALGPIQEGNIEQRGESIPSAAKRFAVVDHLRYILA